MSTIYVQSTNYSETALPLEIEIRFFGFFICQMFQINALTLNSKIARVSVIKISDKSENQFIFLSDSFKNDHFVFGLLETITNLEHRKYNKSLLLIEQNTFETKIM